MTKDDEKLFRGETYITEKMCPEEGCTGYMKYTAEIQNISPVQFIHKCDTCEKAVSYTEKFPVVQHLRTEIVK